MSAAYAPLPHGEGDPSSSSNQEGDTAASSRKWWQLWRSTPSVSESPVRHFSFITCSLALLEENVTETLRLKWMQC